MGRFRNIASGDRLPFAVIRNVAQQQAQRHKPTFAVPDFWTSMAHSTIRTQYGIVPFQPFEWQREWYEGLTTRELILKSRDVGSSEICTRALVHLMLQHGGNLLIKADKQANAINLTSIARQYITSLPESERPKLTVDNKQELELKGVGTIKAVAKGGGRSERCRYLLLTERAFWEDPAKEMAAISGCLVAGGWLIVESTANGFNEFHGLWTDGDYRKTFVPRTANPTHDDDWWAKKQEELKGSPRKIAQEYAMTAIEAFVGSGNCLFDTEVIAEMSKLCRKPIETRLNGQIKIWQRPVVGRRYVAGADVAEGIDAGDDRLDYSGVAIYDWQTGLHVADLHGHWPVDTFAQLANDLCREYNNPLLGVERNNHGHAVLLTLRTLKYPTLYYHSEMTDALASRGRKTLRRVLAGWPTTQKTKPVLEQDFAAAIVSRSMCSYDEALWDECLSYVTHGDGKTGATQGCHDDRAVKHMIAWQMRKHIRQAQRKESVVVGRASVV